MIDTNDIRQRMTECDVSEEDILALCDEIDRLRAVKPKPQGKTVRAVIKVAVDRTETVAIGEDNFQWLLEPRAYYTITADLPIPEDTTVEAEVHTATTDENANSGGGKHGRIL